MAELTSALKKRTRIVSSLGEAKILAVEGKSAYEVAVEEGFEGTVEEWLASLVGPEGPKGGPGPQGAPGAPAKLVCDLRADGTLYVSNLYRYENLEEGAF